MDSLIAEKTMEVFKKFANTNVPVLDILWITKYLRQQKDKI